MVWLASAEKYGEANAGTSAGATTMKTTGWSGLGVSGLSSV
jgi:hypothetical protein